MAGSGPPEDGSRYLPGCIFCKIAQGSADQEKVVFQTDRLVVFHDKSPAAVCHLQVVPKWHIKNLSSLQPSVEDHALVQEMMDVGQQVLQQLHPGASLKFGFHAPPFNSVLHLHMHAMALPHLQLAPTWKYNKHTPWWKTAEQVLAELEPSEDSC